MPSDLDLRRALQDYREHVIYATGASAARRKYGVLRRAMIDHLIAWKPVTKAEWIAELPPYLAAKTDPEQLARHGTAIAVIVARHVQFNGKLRLVAGRRAA